VKVEALRRPFSIGSVRDGGVYHTPGVQLTPTNLFLQVGAADDLYFKVPSERGMGDYRRFIRNAELNALDLRGLEEPERVENLERTLSAYSDLKPLTGISSELAHYAAVHKLQYERLRSQAAVGIPRAHFGALCSTRTGIFRSFVPALFQERIYGTTLWDMFDFDALAVRPEWRACVAGIATSLSALLASGLEKHIDWNIQNFVWEQAGRRLFYVDQKPSLLISRHSNDHNLKGIREYFLA
jgi:hypothetical protein